MTSKRSFTDANLSENRDEEAVPAAMPLKRFFRSRAHCNPLSHNDGFKYPLSPEAAGIVFTIKCHYIPFIRYHHNCDILHLVSSGWALHYPSVVESDRFVRHLDVGMGFGGLTIALAELYPQKLVMGMEIRAKV
jgi:tRNA (guanine-N7-)-methyltransferase